MFDRLRKRLVKWLEVPEEEPKDDPFLDCVLSEDGEMKRATVHILGATGIHLMCETINDPVKVTLIQARQAIDQEKFWRLWKDHNKTSTLTWEETTNDPS